MFQAYLWYSLHHLLLYRKQNSGFEKKVKERKEEREVMSLLMLNFSLNGKINPVRNARTGMGTDIFKKKR